MCTTCCILYAFNSQSSMSVYYNTVVYHNLLINFILYTNFKNSVLPYFNIIYIIFVMIILLDLFKEKDSSYYRLHYFRKVCLFRSRIRFYTFYLLLLYF